MRSRWHRISWPTAEVSDSEVQRWRRRRKCLTAHHRTANSDAEASPREQSNSKGWRLRRQPVLPCVTLDLELVELHVPT